MKSELSLEIHATTRGFVRSSFNFVALQSKRGYG
jgi:hypothetical protein